MSSTDYILNGAEPIDFERICTVSKAKTFKQSTVANIYGPPSGGRAKSLTMSTPAILTWGGQEVLEGEAKKPTGKFSASLQFPNDAQYSNPELDTFLDNMKNVEKFVMGQMIQNGEDWFGEVVESIAFAKPRFNNMLRYPKDKTNPKKTDYSKAPTLPVKIPFTNGQWRTEVYDEDGEPLYPPSAEKIASGEPLPASPVELILRQTQVICLIECGGIWISNKKASVTWNLIQIVTPKPVPSITGHCILKPKASDKEKIKASASVADAGPNTMVPDDGVDGDDGEEGGDADHIYAATASVAAPAQAAPAPTPAPVAQHAATELVDDDDAAEAPVVQVAAKPAAAKRVVRKTAAK